MKRIINLLTIWFPYRLCLTQKVQRREVIPHLIGWKKSSSFSQINKSVQIPTERSSKMRTRRSKILTIKMGENREVHCSHPRIIECIIAIWIRSTDFRISQIRLRRFKRQNRYMKRVSRLRLVIFVQVWTLKK